MHHHFPGMDPYIRSHVARGRTFTATSSFRHPLPGLCVPLAAPDPEITLALQPLVDAVYARSRYDRDIRLSPATPATA